jgi:hypothetical protein
LQLEQQRSSYDGTQRGNAARQPTSESALQGSAGATGLHSAPPAPALPPALVPPLPPVDCEPALPPELWDPPLPAVPPLLASLAVSPPQPIISK